MLAMNRAVRQCRKTIAYRRLISSTTHSSHPGGVTHFNNEIVHNKDSETFRIPSREKMVGDMRNNNHCDVLVIGGGATGAGAALDAATRGLKVFCVEREDFASGTSSRSTKLLWGGSRYLVQAFVSLFSFDLRLIRSPRKTITKFMEEFRMVLNCHRERKYMLEKQPHLAHWLPISVPLTTWLIWPPPFNYPPAALGPLGLFALFFKFYDALSGFSCPPSHVMTPSRAHRKFPQLANNKLKYCSVFYEGMHDDARTNLAVAQTAAREGARIANYCEVSALIKDDQGRVIGAKVKDLVNNNSFDVFAKSVLLCGGPFTDELRHLEDPNSKEAVTGASGIHIVLPSYYAPSGIGLVDMNTSDGRFLFFLPWNDHVVVGTTDHKCQPTMRPTPDETEIKWLLHEASRYLSPDLQLRRQDVLSAWAGIRPLALDPHSSSTASASRDHVISHNPATGVVFISGGKWTTFREMAEDAIDKILDVTPALQTQTQQVGPSKTLDMHLVGHEGYSDILNIRLIQQYNIPGQVAHRLARAYGGRAHEVLRIARETASGNDVKGKGQEPLRLLVTGFPYLEAEVTFAARHDWALHAEDILARRTRLLFLNKEAAIRAIPRVVQLLGRELRWSTARQQLEIQRCLEYTRHFGGSKPMKVIVESKAQGLDAEVDVARVATETDLRDVFDQLDSKHAGSIDRFDLQLAAEMLNHPLSSEELEDCLLFAEQELHCAQGTVSQEAFVKWWNSDRINAGLVNLRSVRLAKADQVEGSGVMFG